MIIKLVFAFGAGFISFLTPCVLPIIPGYISYITGKDLGEIDKDKSIVLTKTILFSLGFSFVFISLVAEPSAPPVPFPINRVSLPSLNASSAFASEVGADDPVDLLILKVFAMLEVSSVYKIFNGASLICFKCTTC